MKTLKIIDKWNNTKTWIVKIYKCGAVYVNQEIKGKKFNKKFTRMTMKQLREIGVMA